MRYVVCFLAMFLLVVGCGRKAGEKAAEREIKRGIKESTGGDARVDIKEDSVSIETEDGSIQMTSGKKARIPEGFPKDVFVYDGAEIQMAMSVPEGFSMVLHTSDTPDKVTDVYFKKMQADGWSREMSADMGGQKMSVFKKGERTVSLVTSSVEGRTQIALTVAND